MAVAVTNGAMVMTVMVRRLLDERRAVGMNASQRDGIRSARRTQCDDSESRCGQDRLHDFFSSSEPQAGVTCQPCFIVFDAPGGILISSHPMPVPCFESTGAP
jgi:hypothetical protein